MVRGGLLRPGQSQVELFDTVELGVLLDLAYELITENMTQDERADFDKTLAEAPADDEPVLEWVRNFRGEMVPVTASRKRQAQSDMLAMAKMTAK